METTVAKKKLKVRDMAVTALLAAVVAVCSLITIPMPTGVPITLQTFAVALAGYLLGAKKGTAAVVLYILIGAVGLPVFSGMKGGVSVLAGPTGGFLWGFIFFALLCGLKSKTGKKWVSVLLGIAGLIVCHALGVLQYSLLTHRPYFESALLVSVPYLLKDTVSLVLAFLAAWQINRILDKTEKES